MAKLKLLTERAMVSPILLALVVLIVASLFVFLRFVFAADGDITKFIVAGSDFTDAAEVGDSIHVFDGPGNDGQFFYRFSVDPTELTMSGHKGVEIDTPLRFSRIGYPMIVWLVSFGGQPGLVPVMLVLVNLVMLGLLAWGFATHAQVHGLLAGNGLFGLLWPGFLFSFARNFADPTAAALVVLAFVMQHRSKHWLYAAFMSMAVLTRETYVVVAFAVFVAVTIRILTSKEEQISRAFFAAVPGGVFVLWQGYVWNQVGEVSVLSNPSNLSFPLSGLGSGISSQAADILAFSDDSTRALMSGLSILQIAVFSYFVMRVVSACLKKNPSTALMGAWVGLFVLATLLSADVWNALADLRNLSELWVIGALILLSSNQTNKLDWGAGLGVSGITVLPRLLRV